MHLPNRFTFCERSEVTSSTFYVSAYRRRLPPTRVYFSSFSTLLPILTTPLNLTSHLQDGDFLLFVLRELLPHAPQLRVILMSATLDARLFCDYYGE